MKQRSSKRLKIAANSLFISSGHRTSLKLQSSHQCVDRFKFATPPAYQPVSSVKCCMLGCACSRMEVSYLEDCSVWPFILFGSAVAFQMVWTSLLHYDLHSCKSQTGLSIRITWIFVCFNTEFPCPSTSLGCVFWTIVLVSLPNDSDAVLPYLGVGNQWSTALVSNVSSTKRVHVRKLKLFA